MDISCLITWCIVEDLVLGKPCWLSTLNYRACSIFASYTIQNYNRNIYILSTLHASQVKGYDLPALNLLVHHFFLIIRSVWTYKLPYFWHARLMKTETHSVAKRGWGATPSPKQLSTPTVQIRTWPALKTLISSPKNQAIYSILLKVTETAFSVTQFAIESAGSLSTTSLKEHSYGWQVSKVWPKYFSFVICSPFQSSPSLTILVSLWFIVLSVWCFSIFVKYYFQVSLNLTVIFAMVKIIQNTVTVVPLHFHVTRKTHSLGVEQFEMVLFKGYKFAYHSQHSASSFLLHGSYQYIQ